MTKQNPTAFARQLRQDQTTAERHLWNKLRNRQLDNWKFKRQVPRRHYIVDFLCAEAKLIIELDGAQHAGDEAIQYDAKRTAYLQASGYHVIRIWNNEVLEDVESVLNTIWNKLQDTSNQKQRPHSLSPEGRGLG